MNTYSLRNINSRVNRLFVKATRRIFAAIASVALLGIMLAPTFAQGNGKHGRRSNSQKSNIAQQQQAATIDAQEIESDAIRRGMRIIKFDVVENAKKFVFDETPLHEDGKPAYGNEFITEGYIYPYGTLTVNEYGVVNGINADGSPEFPEKVIGRWICRGWHTGDGAKTESGDWVVTHQLYNFGQWLGRATLTTDGFELVDVNVPVQRAITGGTGPFAKSRGEAIQTMIGFNQLEGAALRMILKVSN